MITPMGTIPSPNETFSCPLCERRLKRIMLANGRLKNAARMDLRLCRQCEKFIEEGLEFLTDKLRQKKLSYIPAKESDFPLSPIFDGRDGGAGNVTDEVPLKKARPLPPPRAASGIEKEVFFFHSLSVERQIDGFIRGLEAAGIDRGKLSKPAETAINNLLQIAQTLAGQRRLSQIEKMSRADIRRMGRHVDDTSLMVNEYIAAVAEESLEPRSAP